MNPSSACAFRPAPVDQPCWRMVWVAEGTGQPASVQTRTMAAFVSKYTCQ
jgi:hypothetical protein